MSTIVCTLAVYTRAWDDLPLVVAANRDEYYDRPAATPERLGRGAAYGGRDLRAGGSWLALGRFDVVVGVLNRRTDRLPDPGRTSRGTLCVALAEESSAEGAVARLRLESGADYNPFNLLIADRARAYVAQNRDGTIVIDPLGPGLHLLTNLDLNDATCPRISRSTHRFAALVSHYVETRDRARLIDALHLVLADHQMALDDRNPTDQLCIHTPVYGTRSSSLILLPADAPPVFLHAAGPPCRSAYARVVPSWPLDEGALPSPTC